jgi:hypothetical protein
VGDFLGLVRVAKAAALIGAGWTICCALLLLGWQTKTWIDDEIWPTLPVSTVVNKVVIGPGVYLTASAEEPKLSLMSTICEVPAIVPLLVALALLIAFYLWLGHTERSYAKDIR